MPSIGGRRVLAGALVASPSLPSGFQTFPTGATIGGAWHVDAGTADIVVTTTLVAARGDRASTCTAGAPAPSRR
jgi:hypothetical protein